MKMMTKKFVQKNIRLSLEFDDYLAKNPELYDEIPDGAIVIITVKYDRKFNADSISIVRSHHAPKQPLVKAEKSLRNKWNVTPFTLSPA